MTHQNESPGRHQIRIGSIERPGFHARRGYVPRVGERVQTTEGEADVVRVLNRVTDGRLLELRLTERPEPPFFAASNNILVEERSS